MEQSKSPTTMVQALRSTDIGIDLCTDLAEMMIWYILKGHVLNLSGHAEALVNIRIDLCTVDLAEMMIWYILKGHVLNLSGHAEALVNTLFAQ
ncbi:hypothetical protein Tco_0009495 [Tanacetum coccineum]